MTRNHIILLLTGFILLSMTSCSLAARVKKADKKMPGPGFIVSFIIIPGLSVIIGNIYRCFSIHFCGKGIGKSRTLYDNPIGFQIIEYFFRWVHTFLQFIEFFNSKTLIADAPFMVAGECMEFINNKKKCGESQQCRYNTGMRFFQRKSFSCQIKT